MVVVVCWLYGYLLLSQTLLRAMSNSAVKAWYSYYIRGSFPSHIAPPIIHVYNMGIYAFTALFDVALSEVCDRSKYTVVIFAQI